MFVGDGITKSFAVPFKYLNKTDIHVSVNGTLKEFTWLSQGQVVLEAAPEVGAEVLIYRDTPVDEPIVDYEDGSIIAESDLDLPVLQNLYVAQELKDSAADTSETAEAAVDTANKAADSANTALTTSNEALDTANTALESASSAVTTANAALESIGPTVKQVVSDQDIPKQVSDNVDDKLEALNLDTKIHEEVVSAISGVTIPGLTPETIAGALGYTPYNAETNSKDFATTAEVAGAIAAIPEPVNADWNASKGAAAILNKPSTIAGYGIVDAYTKTQVDTKIAKKDCLPTQTGQTGKYLSTDGETPYWEKVDTGAMEVVEVETSGETTTLDIAPGKAYFLTRNGEYAFEGSVLEINSLPEKNNLRESSIWFDTQGQSVTIQINVEHKIVDAIPETEPYSHYVISIMGNTLIMQEMEKKPV